jgi:hypothetical protein
VRHAISPCGVSQTLPIRISLDLYEREVRAVFPQLPSIRRTLYAVRTEVLAYFPSLVTLLGPAPTAAHNSFAVASHPGTGGAPPEELPTLPVDVNAIVAGGSS